MTVSRDHYYKLSSDLEKERIGAAIALINELNEANDDAEWEYALTRLIKGLSSSRGSSRLGFSTCLTELINIRLSNSKLTFPELLELININTKVASSMNGKEERAVLFGKLFGLQCISNLNSGVFSGDFDSENFKLFVDNLIDLACLKSWIREPTLFTIVTLLRSLQGPLDKDSIVYIFTKLDESKLSLTTEGLAIYLSVPPSFRSENLANLTFKNTTWKLADPLHQSNLSTLAKVLKDISSGDEESEENSKANLKKKGTWSPRLHFVWQLIVEELTSISIDEPVDEEAENSKKRKKSSEKSKKKSKSNSKSQQRVNNHITVPEFWKVIIDEGFFSEKSSHERKYWGFEIFELLITVVSVELTDSLFTQNFMRTLINQSADNNRLLNKVAKKTLLKITEITAQQPEKTILVLKSLLIGDYGSLQFDRLTKTKTVENLVANPVSNGKLAEFFIEILQKPKSDDIDSVLKAQKWAIDQLLHLVRAKKAKLDAKSDLEWIDSILKALVQVAYFKESDEQEESPISEFAQERLNSILSDVVTIERTDNQTWSFKTLSSLLDYAKDHKPIFDFDEELKAVKDKSLKILKKIRNKRESSKHIDNSRLLVFEILFSMVTLQLFSGDTESVDTLQELQDYYYENKKDSNDEDDNDEDHDSVIGIVEILLNFVSQKSSLLKKLSMIVWENFCEKVDLGALELLFDVIKTKENKEGQKALFEGEDEFVDEDESEEEHDHDHSDEDEDDEEESDDDESEESEEDEDEEEAEDEVVNELDKKTNVALAEALKLSNYNGEVTFSSDDDDDMSDESMDDEQMMAIDGELSRIFKQRRDALDSIETGNKRKAEVQDARSNILLFKHRVLDLLEIFIKKNPTSELIIYTVEPLLTGLKLTLDKSLGTKIHKLLKSRVCKSKVDIKTVSKEQLLEILQSIQKDVLKTSNTNDFNLSSSQCSIFISKQILQLDESAADEIIDQYTDLLKLWFAKKNSRLTSSIFFDFINWLSSKRSNQNP